MGIRDGEGAAVGLVHALEGDEEAEEVGGVSRADVAIRVVAMPGDVWPDVGGFAGDVGEVADDVFAFQDFAGGIPQGRIEDEGTKRRGEERQVGEEEGDFAHGLAGYAGVPVGFQSGEGEDVRGPARVAGVEGLAEFFDGGQSVFDDGRVEELGEDAVAGKTHGGEDEARCVVRQGGSGGLCPLPCARRQDFCLPAQDAANSRYASALMPDSPESGTLRAIPLCGIVYSGAALTPALDDTEVI